MERCAVRKRMLSPGFFQDESLAACSPLARLLFAGLWTLCDRDGRMRWVPPVVHGQLFPFDPDAAVEALVTELAAAGCVVLYAVEGRRYLACPSWHQHQKPHKNEPASDIPAPPEPSVPSRVSHWSKSSQPLVEATRSLPESESESESVPPKPPIAHPPHRPPAAAAFDEEPRTDPLDLYHRLTGRRSLTIPPAQQERLLAICQRASSEEVAEREKKASGADRPLGYFLALFEPDGAPRPLRDKEGGNGNGSSSPGLRRFSTLVEWERDRDAQGALGWASLASAGQRPHTAESLTEYGRSCGEDLEPIAVDILGWLRKRGDLPPAVAGGRQ